MKLEYGLLVALIASVLVIGLTHTSRAVSSPFQSLEAVILKAQNASCEDEQVGDERMAGPGDKTDLN